MSKVVRTTPTMGERAIITEYGYRTPATFVGKCADKDHDGDHWCYDETNSDGTTWTSQPALAREPIPTHGDRAIVTYFGLRTPATYVESCDKHARWVSTHWCFDEPTPSGATWSYRQDVTREPMSLTMPAVGDRAIITEYGGRIPATFVKQCAGTHAAWATSSHWCYDEPAKSGATWTSHPHVAREPIPAPREWQPGDVVDHPKHGRGFVYKAAGDRLVVRSLEGVWPTEAIADDLTLVLPAPAPPVVKPDEPQRLGAVVLDGDDVWLLAEPGTTHPWYHVGEYDWRTWAEFPDNVKLLSGGDTDG